MKKPYKKPKIKRVKLIAEEAVLTGCRTTADRTGRACSNPGCGGSADVTT